MTAPLLPALLAAILALVVLEFAALAILARSGRGIPPRQAAPMLAAGAGLVAAMLALATAAGLPAILACLTLALVAHLLDLRSRWRR